MQVTLLNRTWDFPNEQDKIDQLITKINNEINSSSFHYSHLIIDGVEVYTDPYEFIVEHIAEINQIEVAVQTVKQMLDGSMFSMQNYLVRAIPEIQQLADAFYREVNEESWKKFNQFLEGIQWILQVLSFIEKNQDIYSNFAEYMRLSLSLHGELANLEEALQNNDLVLVGDIIGYEVFPIMESIQSELNKTIDSEVERENLN